MVIKQEYRQLYDKQVAATKFIVLGTAQKRMGRAHTRVAPAGTSVLYAQIIPTEHLEFA